MRLLIADDELVIQRGLMGLPWHEVGITKTACISNGTEVLRLLCSFKPNILLLDIQMPGLTGLELARMLQEQNATCKLLLLSGYGTFEYAQKAVKYGVFEYLLKPSSTKEILESVQRAVYQIKQEGAEKKRNELAKKKTDAFSTEEKTITDILHYIEQNYMTDISLASLSESMHFSTAYLSRFIKNETGVNFVKLLTTTRMLRAAELLTNTDLKVYSICERVGIADQRYFSQVFRRTFGQTPIEYRKLNIKKNYDGLLDLIKTEKDKNV